MIDTLNPFRLPVHPPLVHFPIALLVLAWIFLLIRYSTGDVRWDERSRLIERIGVATLPVVVIAAVIDTRGFSFLSPPRWDAPLVWHALGGICVSIVFAGHLLWRTRFPVGRLTGRLAALDLSVASFGVWLLLAVGLIAGEMVYAS
ncbi:MAG TPA: DUF2231 domain-containing protein [Actinomycetota bacterium]|nr:DUF2231 domain-containing protein [Actinomycetota bacterium]